MKKLTGFHIGRIVYSILSLAFGIAAIYHFVALISPDIFPPSPTWRHSVFIGLCIIGILLSVRRWIWFWIPFTILTIQQLISHGSRAYEWWTIDHRVDVISIIIILSMPLIAAFLFYDFILRMKTKL